jgi:hypothetical protein
MYKTILAAAVCATIAPALCRAGDAAPTTSDTNAMLNQVIQIASAGQTPETQAEVKKYVEDNQGPLTAIMNEAMIYLTRAKNSAANGGNGMDTSANANVASDSTGTPAVATSDSTASQPVVTSAPPPTTQVEASDAANIQPNEVQHSEQMHDASLQQSGALQASAVQPSGGLTTGHLKGYPSLPNVDPITSVKTNTPGQAEYVQKVNAEEEARKNALKTQSEMGN